MLLNSHPAAAAVACAGGKMPLLCAIEQRQNSGSPDWVVVMALLKAYPGAAAVGRGSMLPLHYAAERRPPGDVEALLDANPAAAATPDERGSLPLHYAAK